MSTDALLLLFSGAFGTSLALLYAVAGLRAIPSPEASATSAVEASAPERKVSLAALARPSEGEEMDALRQMLAQAGLRERGDMDAFLLTRTLLALALPVITALSLSHIGFAKLAVAALLTAGLGYYIPWFYVQNRRLHRQEALTRSLPDALDMLVSCVEAGQGLDAALNRVTREIRHTAPDLADELDLVNAEAAAGLARAAALRRMDQRTGVPDINSLVNVLSYAERYGAGIADSIRAHAQLVRRRRTLVAEERANKASPKLTVIMILFILPAMFVVVLGPAIINIVQLMLPTLNGVTP